MKKLLVALAFVASFGTARSQAVLQGDVQITASAGYSLVGALWSTITDAAQIVDPNVKGGPTPVINAMIDYAVTDNFTIGVAGSYQSFTIKYTDAYAANQGTNGGLAFKDQWSCMNFGLRPLFHFGDNEKLDMYAGIRASYTLWNYKNDNSSTGWSEASVSLPTIGVMPLLGGNVYFSDNIGLNMEFGFGTYLAAAGLNIKI